MDFEKATRDGWDEYHRTHGEANETAHRFGIMAHPSGHGCSPRDFGQSMLDLIRRVDVLEARVARLEREAL